MPISERTGLGRVLRPVALCAMLALLAGCEATGNAGALAREDKGQALSFLSSVNRSSGMVLRSAEVAGGDVVIHGPAGYCIEGRSLKKRARYGFALLARCDILSGGKIGTPVALALLTVTVTPYGQGAGDPADLPDARTLSREFPAGDVLAASDVASVRLLHLATGGDSFAPGADPRQWRAAFVLNGYLVSLAAYGPQGSTVADKGGRALLLDMAKSMRTESPKTPARATADTPAPAPATPETEATKAG
ncbi:hypothetical protein DL237_16765 [Pseudooceanicola sediminis]|uniref:Uncharacterized protein n=1 Tax=Pseudooceanicola sediminis TaxID=2211117 RepID=A0A399J3J0_9RHOB|nr:hypothetical protein [Pseudooceanicola sediminis]KAA2312528.1 hypothetical protein E0K93_17010 [Puniceibacterium sp. HSS470]RII37536.1 hypothetical protein DL237_16765 [Pseudooceanicola sediminis]|tara:strand:- start:56194 stop:56940 length:747 start_codon:yes stop_codon:yes gene_type:complete